MRALAATAAALLVGVAAGEALRAWAGWRPEASRRLVHSATGVLAAVLIPRFESPTPLYVLAGAFALANGFALHWRRLPGMHAVQRRTAGTVIFPIALIVGLALTWSVDRSRVPALQAAFLVLGLADPLASIVGERIGNGRTSMVAGHRKTVAGSAAFAVAAFVMTAAALSTWGPPLPVAELVARAAVAAMLATAAEALGTRGWDNLFVVVAVIGALVAPSAGLIAAIVAVAFAAAAWRARWLDPSGALAAGLLAWTVLQPASLAWAAPGVAFFVLSSLLSKLGRKRKAAAARLAAKTGPRDAAQVLANGGVAGALVLAHVLLPDMVAPAALFWAAAGAFAAAAADTWATEIGTMVGGPTRRLPGFARVPAGESGGVSVAGTLGAIAGAASVFAAAWIPAAGRPEFVAGVPAGEMGLIVVGGALAASLIDSLLGGTLQGRYRTADGALADRARGDSDENPLAAGVRWIDNDRVNLACTAVGAAIPLALVG